MEAAFNCSDWVFLLRQKPESIEMLHRKGRLSDGRAASKRLLNSLRTEAGSVRRALHLVARRRGRRAQRSSTQQRTCSSRTSSQDNAPHRRAARAGPLHRRSDHRAAAAAGARRCEGPSLRQRRRRGPARRQPASRCTTGWVLRPALVVGVVDLSEVYRAKEAAVHATAHGRLRQRSEGERDTGTRPWPAASRRRLPAALDELPRECGCLVVLKHRSRWRPHSRRPHAGATSEGGPAMNAHTDRFDAASSVSPEQLAGRPGLAATSQELLRARAPTLVSLPARASPSGHSRTRGCSSTRHRACPCSSTWTPSLPYRMALDAAR
jgi:hypothetical protein